MNQPTITRTKEQIAANAFDLDLFRLISRAEHQATMPGRQMLLWLRIATLLRQGRPAVREMMHPTDRAETL